MSRMVELKLPYPPTVNTYWRRAGHHIYITDAGRTYRDNVIGICLAEKVPCLLGDLFVRVDVHPPDKRRRDLDNLAKALLDSLAHGGVYKDDNQIKRLWLHWCDKVKGGAVLVRVSELLP